MWKVTRAMDSVKTIRQSLLASMENLAQPQPKFLLTLFSTLVISCGRATFANLSRYSHLNERTYRRQYQRSFNFRKFNPGRARPRKYAGKVDLTDYTHPNFNLVTQLSNGVKLYTVVVWSISLQPQIRLVYLLNNSASSSSYAVLFCTDLELDAFSIYLYYKARFQIERGGCWGFPSLSNHVVELVFRDSQQFTGLADCQARDLTKLDFHFNSSLTALNLAQ